MKNVPVLVFANKMDIATLKPLEIVQKLGLHQLRRQWHLQSCCALNGDGLIEGFEWLRK
jgi:signal recognition particle receptor subunit beta